MTGEPVGACPWSWHKLPCALGYGHPSPHHIVGEQPRFDQILEEAAAVARAEAPRPEPWRLMDTEAMVERLAGWKCPNADDDEPPCDDHRAEARRLLEER